METTRTTPPELALDRADFESRAISPLRELGAYEVLWDRPDTTFKTLSQKFPSRPNAVPSDFVAPAKAQEYAEFVQRRFREAEVTRFGVRVHGAGEYPQKLRDAAHPVELLMSALTEGTIIVEAGETSGTLIQARAALHQGRKLFILDNCFCKGLTWPKRFAEKGAIRVMDYDDIRQHLSPTAH
jgi:DNA recombination-mediator protein A